MRRSILIFLVLAPACGSRSVPAGDQGPDGPAPIDYRVRDWRWPTDWRRPADWRQPVDRAVPLDRHVLPDLPQPCSKTIGTPCNSPADCCGGLGCVSLPTGITVCTRTCIPDDPATRLVVEDDCPNLVMHTCAKVDPVTQATYCLTYCDPVLGQTTCPAGVACRPESNLMTDDLSKAVCAYPACTSGKDCPVVLSEACNPMLPVVPCTSSPPGAFCHVDSTATAGKCALAGTCDLVSGLCGPHTLGKPTAKVGDPCADDRNCGAAMRCDQQNASGTMHARNGYCVVDGCAFSSLTTCPAGSTCQHLFPGGRCFKICDLTKPVDCRNCLLDKHGDYECYAWNNLSVGSNQVAQQPTCEPADPYPCSFWGAGSGLTCAALGLQGNPTQMACRVRATGAILPDNSPNGFCLDITTSGN